jgi:hypothetical protein
MDMRFEIHAFRGGSWAGPETPKAQRRSANLFKVTWRQALQALDTETAHLRLAGPVIIEIGCQDYDIRADRQGLLARTHVAHPGAVVSFETKQLGPMRYAADAYERAWAGGLLSWQANVRAVTLTLEALRSINRWGVAKSAQQYAGFLALPPGGTVTFATTDDALSWMRSRQPGSFTGSTASDLYRALAREMHPDQAGADPDDWERLQAARLLLREAGKL